MTSRATVASESAMHPKLERLYIHNYRCFLDFEFHPQDRWLLLGYNGTGKTTIFEVLGDIYALVVGNQDVTELFPPTLSKLIQSPVQRIELDVASEWGTFRYTLQIEHDVARDTCVISSEKVTLEDKPLYGFFEGAVQLYRDDHTAHQSIAFGAEHSFLAALEPQPETTRLQWFKSFLERMLILDLDPRAMKGIARSEDNTLDDDGGNFGAWCRHLLVDNPDGVQRAKKALEGILDGFESIRMQQDGRARVVVVKWRQPNGASYELDFEDLSHGQKIIITLYLLLYCTAPRASLLCLDEPDNFISIREVQPFLVELATLSEDTGLQVLIISHTAEVIDYISADRAILFERPDGGATRIGKLVLTNDGPLRLSELMARGWHAEG